MERGVALLEAAGSQNRSPMLFSIPICNASADVVEIACSLESA